MDYGYMLARLAAYEGMAMGMGIFGGCLGLYTVIKLDMLESPWGPPLFLAIGLAVAFPLTILRLG